MANEAYQNDHKETSARWAELPANPGNCWHSVDLGRQAIKKLPDMFTITYFIALGAPEGIKPLLRKPGRWYEQEKADRLDESEIRSFYAKAAPIVAAGRLATELRGFAPEADRLQIVGLLTPAGEYMAISKDILTWFKRQFPGCRFYLGEHFGPRMYSQGNSANKTPLIAVTHDAYTEPVGIIAGCYNDGLPANGELCELSMPANAGIAKPYHPKANPGRIKHPRKAQGKAKKATEIRLWLASEIRKAAENEIDDAFLVVTAGACTYRIHHDRETLLGFADRLAKSGACFPGSVSIEVELPITEKEQTAKAA
jgi:hypothetical protein